MRKDQLPTGVVSCGWSENHRVMVHRVVLLQNRFATVIRVHVRPVLEVVVHGAWEIYTLKFPHIFELDLKNYRKICIFAIDLNALGRHDVAHFPLGLEQAFEHIYVLNGPPQNLHLRKPLVWVRTRPYLHHFECVLNFESHYYHFIS